ncbi:lysozyme [Pantoea stewartii]|uniref:Lysozyme n=1 Tax=Pantoea stewartii TaxID=66269 RepID=A0AB34VII0_9GAMM|nr:lysozyme [Pantoea stewartii]KTS99188.1 lysozyme [Pantoea stewartii]KTT09768.1 lysozyme [Pantoea stewartii]
MISKTAISLIVLLVIALLTASGTAFYYRGNAIDFKSQRDKASGELKMASATINDMQARQRDVAALDEKYTKELADAKATIDQLHDDVANGKRRLQLNATCTKQSTTATASLDDAGSARLTDSAQRNYFTLRERIETASKQIAGLQQYIKEQCN